MKKFVMLPAGGTEFTYEYYFRRFSSRFRAIYVATLLAITAAFAACFFISAGIVVKGVGTLAAPGGRSWIKAPVSGKVAAVMVRENQSFEAGAPLFVMESDMLDQEASYLRKRRWEVDRKLADLSELIVLCREMDDSRPVSLVTSLYRQQYRLLKQEVAAASLHLRNTSEEFQRHRKLFSAGVVAASEFAEYRFSMERARSELDLLYRQWGSRWQEELDRLQSNLLKIAVSARKLREKKNVYAIRAPADGSLQMTEGLRPGAFFNQGEKVARLSSDSGLCAKIWISPARIGLVREGMPVLLQVDAFNYQQWGLIRGSVIRISEDVVPAPDGTPFFEVICAMEKRALVLNNGYRGQFRKGMSVRARLLVAERTLFQLLTDSLDDWLDPYGQNKG